MASDALRLRMCRRRLRWRRAMLAATWALRRLAARVRHSLDHAADADTHAASAPATSVAPTTRPASSAEPFPESLAESSVQS